VFSGWRQSRTAPSPGSQCGAFLGLAATKSRLRRSTPGIGDRLALVHSLRSQTRVDQVVHRHRVFTHQVARKRIAPLNGAGGPGEGAKFEGSWTSWVNCD
jgi:hypothetical protein